MFSSRLRLVAVVAALACAVAGAQPALADDPLRIRLTQVDATNFPDVRVVASIVDSQDRPVSGLAAREIVLSEQGRTQSATVEVSTESAPIALALVLDTSGSMAGRPIADAKSAMEQLIRSLGPKDQSAVLTFNTRVVVDQSLTTDKDALVAATGAAAAAGNTAIFDGVAKAIDVLAAAPPQARRGIVLLTDGVDNSSSINLPAVSERVRAQGYPVYVIGLGTNLDQRVLQTLADASRGGQAFVAPSSAQLASIYATLSERILTEYIISYHSNVRDVRDGTPLTLTVQVTRAGAILGSTSVIFEVPAGHGVTAAVAATAEPAAPAPAVVAQPATGPYSPEVAALLGTASALSLLLWVFVISTSYSMEHLERRRVGELAAAAGSLPVGRTQGRSFFERVVLPILARIGRRFGRITSGSLAERTQQRLSEAGDPFALGPVEFLGLQLGACLVGTALFAAAAAFGIGPQLGWIVLIGLAGALVGILVPSVWLDRVAKNRRRQIQRALPSALDMLALSARAGMTFDGAISQVVQRWDSPLSDEFRRILAEFRMGRDRRDALRAMAERTGVPDVKRFANAVVQADSLGVPISKVLLDQSIEMRTRRRQRAEESARTAPVKMLFPMVGLIFPALFVVILGPAVPRFLELFATAH
jgi:tight adherence protein C